MHLSGKLDLIVVIFLYLLKNTGFHPQFLPIHTQTYKTAKE